MIQSKASLTSGEFPLPRKFEKVVFACCGDAELPGNGWSIEQLVVVCPSAVLAPPRMFPESTRVCYVDALLGTGLNNRKFHSYSVAAFNSTRKLITDINAAYPGVEMLSENVVAQTTLKMLVDGFELDVGGTYLLCLDMIGDGPALFDWVANSRASFVGLGAVLMRVGIDAVHEGAAGHEEILQMCKDRGLAATSMASEGLVHSAWIFVDFGGQVGESDKRETEIGMPRLAVYSASQVAAMRDAKMAAQKECLDLRASLEDRVDQLTSTQLELQRTKTALADGQAKLTTLEANGVDIEEHLGSANVEMGRLAAAVEKLTIVVDGEAAQTRVTRDEIQATMDASFEKWIVRSEDGAQVQLEDQEKLKSLNSDLSRENKKLSSEVARSNALTKKAIADLNDQIQRHEKTNRYARRLEALLGELAVHLPEESSVKDNSNNRKKRKKGGE